MLSYVEFYEPSYFLLENVVGLLVHPLMSSQAEGRRGLEGGIKMGVVKFIERTLIALGCAFISTPNASSTNPPPCPATRSATKSFKLDSMAPRKAGCVLSSGAPSVGWKYPTSRCQHIVTPKACAATGSRSGQSCNL